MVLHQCVSLFLKFLLSVSDWQTSGPRQGGGVPGQGTGGRAYDDEDDEGVFSVETNGAKLSSGPRAHGSFFCLFFVFFGIWPHHRRMV